MAGKLPKALIEVSSEAGRKIGGIYTVLRSKSGCVHSQFKDNYLLIGFLDEKCGEDVKFEEPPSAYRKIFDELEQQGVHCKYGKWMYGDNSRIICVDAKEMGERIVEFVNGSGLQKDKQVNHFKYMLWKRFGIDSLTEKSWDFNENIVWCYGVGMLIEKLFANRLFKEGETAMQFHEWIAGAALLYCKMKGIKTGTVFTTHATVLGRTLSAGGFDVYTESKKAKQPIGINVAYANHVEGKHQLEVAAARESTIFTTVSQTVGDEVKYILGRAPDVITVNGIEFEKDREGKKAHDLSNYMRFELLQAIEANFVAYYPQKYEDALLVYMSGRYEFSNKGFDIFINALGKLNARLKKDGKEKRRVFAFIFSATTIRGPKISLIKNYLLIDKIGEVLNELPETKGARRDSVQESLAKLHGDIKADILNMAKGFVKDGDRPHINWYDLADPNDAIINACIAAKLTNAKDDVVKMAFYPTYMKPNDGLMNMSYYDVISGFDVGVFPSRYEPFGYTPVEAALKHDMAVTSDMTGFGRFMLGKVKGRGKCGLIVLRMAGRKSGDIEDELAKELEKIYRLAPAELEKRKKDAYGMMRHIDWRELVKNYYCAYEMAVKKREG